MDRVRHAHLLELRPLGTRQGRSGDVWARACLAAAAVAAVFLALGASAAQARPFEALEEQAYSEAVAWWGMEPPCKTFSGAVEPLPPGEGGYAGIPLWPFMRCTITLTPEEVSRPGLLCLGMRHEVGHLLGYMHSEDPNSIMYPNPQWIASPECLALEAEAAPRLIKRHRHRRRHHATSPGLQPAVAVPSP